MSHEASPDDVTVSGLFSYPVKSCGVVAHARATLSTTGLQHDRSWMFVDPRRSPAQFITQRECPEMATVVIEVLPDGSLRASKSGCGEVIVQLPLAVSALCKVKVWSSELIALDAGDSAAAWFADALGLSVSAVRLVQFHPQQQRKCNALFADGYPVLITNAASLADLNRRMNRGAENAMPMNRFRPNIVLSGLPAWDEDHVDVIDIDDVMLKLVKPCVRCQITTTDQLTGSRLSEEPLNTLARFRNNPDLGGVTFGWNAIVLREGTIELNATASVTYRF
jgi:uncharacterized protein